MFVHTDDLIVNDTVTHYMYVCCTHTHTHTVGGIHDCRQQLLQHHHPHPAALAAVAMVTTPWCPTLQREGEEKWKYSLICRGFPPERCAHHGCVFSLFLVHWLSSSALRCCYQHHLGNDSSPPPFPEIQMDAGCCSSQLPLCLACRMREREREREEGGSHLFNVWFYW